MSRRNRKARAVASCGSSHTATAQVSEALPVSNGVRIPPSVDTGYAYDANGMLRQGMAIDAGMAQKLYGPAKTLGAPQDVQMACDNALEESGVYSLLAHTINMGSAPLTQFMGYGALQGLAQNGLIRACVETVADDMTRNWIELKREGEVGAEKKTTGDIFMESLGLAPKSDEEEIVENTLIADLNAAMEKYNLQKVFHEAATLVGYEGGALVFIDTGAQGDELKLPLNMTEYSQELRGNTLRFICIDPVNVFPGPYNATSPLREDYFKPSSWWVLGQEVHASRLLRLTANECPVLLKPAYNFFGIPQAQILWDYVLHFQECRVASQRLLSKFSLTVFKTPMAEVLTEAEGTALLDRRMAYMVKNRSNDGILCIDKDTEDVVKLETPISGVTDVVRQSLEILAALNRTPAVKLLGISPSGFNATGESDIRNYYDHIRSQQEKVFREALTTCLNVIQVHDKGEIDKSVSFEFAALGEADNAAIATTQKTKTDTMVALLQNNVISPEEARRALADDPDSGFNNIDVDELPEPQGGEMGGMPDMGDLSDLPESPAQDADPEKWASTESGAHYPVEKGQSKEEACNAFVERKKQEKVEQQSNNVPARLKKDIKDKSYSKNKRAHEVAALSDMTAEEHDALFAYSQPYTGLHKEINNYHRFGGTMTQKAVQADKAMQQAFKRASLKSPIVVYRGIPDDDFARKLIELEVGKTFTDKGYSSASSSQRQATAFARTSSGVVMRIRAGEGAKAISMKGHSAVSKEKEIAFDRSSTFQKIGMFKDEKNGMMVIDMAYVPVGQSNVILDCQLNTTSPSCQEKYSFQRSSEISASSSSSSSGSKTPDGIIGIFSRLFSMEKTS